jgi:hypothetical protein
MRDRGSIAAREKRGLGVFVLLLGAGLILDAASVWTGSLLMVFGLIVFAWGMSQSDRAPEAAQAVASHLPETRP